MHPNEEKGIKDRAPGEKPNITEKVFLKMRSILGEGGGIKDREEAVN